MTEDKGILEKIEEEEAKEREDNSRKPKRKWILPTVLGVLLTGSILTGLRELPVKISPADYDRDGQIDYHVRRGLVMPREELYVWRSTEEQGPHYVRINLKDNDISRTAIQEQSSQATSFGWRIDAHRF